MTTPLIDPDKIGKILDADTEALDAESEGVGAITPDNMGAIFDNPLATGSVRTNEIASQNALIQNRGADLNAINLAKADVDATASLAQSAEDLFVDLEGKLSDAGKGFSEITPDEFPSILAQMVAGQKGINAMRNSPVATELAVIERANKVPLAQAVKEELAVSLALRNTLSTMLDKRDLLDKTSDIGGNFLPLRMALDFEDVKAGIKADKELSKYLSGDSIEGMLGTWQALPTPLKTMLMKPLVKVTLAATGVDYSLGLGIPFLKSDANVLNAAGILLRFMQPEGGSRAKDTVVALSAIDVVSLGIGELGGGALKSAKAGTQLAALSKLPVGTRKAMEGVLIRASDYARRINNPIKLIGDAGVKQIGSAAEKFASRSVAKRTAAELNLAAIANKEIAAAHGISSMEAYTNAMPIVANSMNPGWIEGLTIDTADILNSFIRGEEGFVRSMTTEADLLSIGVLNKSDRVFSVKNFHSDMISKREDLLLEGIQLTNVSIIPGTQNSKGFHFRYTMTNTKMMFMPKDGSPGEAIPTEHIGFRSWKVDEQTGNFVETAEDLMSSSVSSIPGLSPSAWSVTKAGDKLDFNDAVKQAIQLTDIATAAKGRLNANWIEANKDISGLKDVKARERIQLVEMAGDGYVNKGTLIRRKVFTERELIAGIQTVRGTVHLTKPNEVAAYYKRRVFADSMWSMQNYITRRELEIGGFSNSIVAKGQTLAVKMFPDPEAAKASAARRPNYNVFMLNDNVSTRITPELIEDMYKDGRVLVRSRNDWNTTGAGDLAVGGEVVEYLFVEANRLRALPEQVLNYSEGYVPKIDEGVEFVVKQHFSVNKAGVPGHRVSHALAEFSSEKEAKIFVDRQVATFMEKNPKFEEAAARAMFSIADGGQMAQLERMENALSGSGGLFTGTRSASDLLMGLDGVQPERVFPTEAFGRYIDHLGRTLSHNEWRIGQEKQWLNTVAKMDRKINLEGFNGTRLPDSPLGKALGRIRNQINTVNRAPSRQESLFEGAAQKYHDWVLEGSRGMGLKKTSIKHALWLKHADPVAAVLAANMHFMLGALNPAQIYVQASAAVVALSLSRIRDIPGIIETTVRFSMLDNIRNTDTFNTLVQKLVKEKQIAPEEVELYMAWRKSGLLESVRSNADLNYISSTGVGITADVLRKADNASLLFYRVGELVNRRVSFIAAFTRWRADNAMTKLIVKNELTGLQLFNNEDALSAILKDANRTMLELNGANKAWWQGGAGKGLPQRIFSMTGQFQQVLAKTVEGALKGERRGGFSLRQKARIAAGQLLTFGSSGMPILNVVAPAMLLWMGLKPDESTVNTINQGVAGLVAKEMFGANIDVSNRAALISGTLTTLKDIMTSKEPMWAKLLAVTGTTGVRVKNAIQEASMVARSQALTSLAELEPLLMHDRSGETEMSEPTMLETARDIAVILAKSTSTGRSLYKAYMMHNIGKILDRRGRVVIDRSDSGGFSFADKMGVSLGFSYTPETRVRQVQRSNKEVDEVINTAVQVMADAYYRYVFVHNMNPDYAQSVKNVVQLTQEGTLGGNPEYIDRAMTNLSHRIFSEPTSLEERELKKFFERTAPEKIAEGVLLDTTLGLNPSNVFNEQAIVVPFQQTLEQENK